MFKSMLNLFSFGCRHSHLSVPFSVESMRQNQAHTDWETVLPPGCSHYVVCLDCGQRFAYDWGNMKVIKTRLRATGTAH